MMNLSTAVRRGAMPRCVARNAEAADIPMSEELLRRLRELGGL